jgi:hypothetical protein
MSARFAPCPTCARHVKQSESKCPFCGEKVPRANAPVARVVVGRLSRSALYAASAAGLAITAADCSSSSAPYGVPAVTVPLSDAAVGDASGDAIDAESSTLIDAAATGDAPEASSDTADGSSSSTSDAAGETGPSEAGSVQPLYGAVAPPTDAGEHGHEPFDGSAIALYGAAPINHG